MAEGKPEELTIHGKHTVDNIGGFQVRGNILRVHSFMIAEVNDGSIKLIPRWQCSNIFTDKLTVKSHHLREFCIIRRTDFLNKIINKG